MPLPSGVKQDIAAEYASQPCLCRFVYSEGARKDASILRSAASAELRALCRRSFYKYRLQNTVFSAILYQ